MIAEKQAAIATRQSEIAADQVRMTRVIERGFLSVSLKATLERTDPVSGSYSIVLELKNTGRTPITAISAFLCVQTQGQSPPAEGPNFEIGSYLAPGDSCAEDLYPDFVPPPHESDEPTPDAVIAGFILCRDEFGTLRRRGFGFTVLIPSYSKPLPTRGYTWDSVLPAEGTTTCDTLTVRPKHDFGFNYDEEVHEDEEVQEQDVE